VRVNIHHEHEFNRRDNYVLFQFLGTSFVQVIIERNVYEIAVSSTLFISIMSVIWLPLYLTVAFYQQLFCLK
jgi:hypothetical protein